MNLGPRWYVAHTYSGYENKVKANLDKIVENRGLGHLIFESVIPTETIVVSDGDSEAAEEIPSPEDEDSENGETKRRKTKAKKPKTIEEKIFPSYVLIKMIMTDESWHVVRNISGVTGFVGPGSKPVPLTDEEVAMINLETKTEQRSSVEAGDTVEIIDGPFVGYVGKVQSLTPDGASVTVLISTAGRDMPVMLEIKHVKKK